MAFERVEITRDNGEKAVAMAPVIISASRSTDIPAFYCKWFFHRLDQGYCAWINPFNGRRSFVSFEKMRFIVFWSKNPKPLLKYLPVLKERNIGCCVQYALNDYEGDGLEGNVASLSDRVDTFRKLVEVLGYGSVVWRFDPLVLADSITVETLLEKIDRLGGRLRGYTGKLVFSFADIGCYRRVESNLRKNNIRYKEWDGDSMLRFARGLSELNRSRGWNYVLASCAEEIDLGRYGIVHNACVDEDLIIRLRHEDEELMNFLGVKECRFPQRDLFSAGSEGEGDSVVRWIKTKSNLDKGQRKHCRCIVSKDIGQYGTCPHQCEYCYANSSKELALRNYKAHCRAELSESILGG